MYRRWSSRKATDASRLNFVMVTLATTGDGRSAASLGPRRNSRVGECAPSVPMRRFPVARVPSAKVTVTFSLPVSMFLSFFPHYIV